MVTTRSDDEGIKIFSEIDDDARVNEGRCKGVLKFWATLVVDCSKWCFTRDSWDRNMWRDKRMIELG